MYISHSEIRVEARDLNLHFSAFLVNNLYTESLLKVLLGHLKKLCVCEQCAAEAHRGYTRCHMVESCCCEH